MMVKLTNRKRVRASEWLARTVETDWRQVQPPPPDGLGIQQVDLAASLNSDAGVEKINDAFKRVNGTAGDPPSRAERVGSDGEVAIAIHKALTGISPRQACDADLWAYLATFGCPQYVRWRWLTNKPGALWTRLAGNIRRNALSRLWWWAEITHDPTKALSDPQRYAITKNVRDRQSLMLWFVDCAFSGHLHIVRGLSAIQQTHSLDDDSQKKLCRSVNRLARVVCLDSLQRADEVEKWCDRAHRLSALLRA
jgi:hypothetical protein